MSIRQLAFDRAALLAEATARVRTRGELRVTLEREGPAAAAVETCLEEARCCVEALFAPAVLIKQVEVHPADDGVCLADGTPIRDRRLRRLVEAGGTAHLYLATCGYDSQEAFARLGGDYCIQHFQTLVGRELLFAVGRALHSQYARLLPERRVSRHPLKLGGDWQSGSRAWWDAGLVFALLRQFGDETLGISVTPHGCFSPLHSMLGLMVALPANRTA